MSVGSLPAEESGASMPSRRLLRGAADVTGSFQVDEGGRGWNFEPAHELAIAPPVSIRPPEFEVDVRYGAGPTFVLELADGYVHPETGFAFTADRAFIRETAVVGKYVELAEQLHPRLAFESARVLGGDGPVAVLSNQRSANWSHWWLDILAKAFLIERRPPAAGPAPTAWVVNMPSSPQQAEALLALGLDTAYSAAGEVLVRGPLLLCNGLTFWGAQQLSSLVRDFSAWTLDKFGPRPAPPPGRGRRLYVSRATAGMRRLTNEAEVAADLRLRGFEIVTLEAMSLAQQVEAFRDADVVVAPHGAGLTNILFSRPGTLVLELFPEGGVHSSTFRRMASHLNQPYALYIGEARPSRAAAKNPSNADFSVDPARLANFIDTVSRAHAPRR